jgi:hypothetical protein
VLLKTLSDYPDNNNNNEKNIYGTRFGYSFALYRVHRQPVNTVRARICNPFKEPRNRFLARWAGTTTLFVVTARQATLAVGIDSSEPISGLLKRLQIRTLFFRVVDFKNGKDNLKKVVLYFLVFEVASVNFSVHSHTYTSTVHFHNKIPHSLQLPSADTNRSLETNQMRSF